MHHRRLSIGLIVPSLATADGEIATPGVSTLVAALAGEVDLRVFPLRVPATRARVAHGNALVCGIDGGGLRLRRLAPRVLRAIADEHRRRRFDALHALWLHEPGTLALLAGRALRVPTLLSIGGAEVARVPEISYGGALDGWPRRVNRAALRHAGLVSGGSRYVLRLARALCPKRHPADFRLAPLPVDAHHFAPADARADDPAAPRLLHAASLTPVKDQSLLLRAFAHIADRRPAARLDIVGEDPRGERVALERLAEELGLRERARFVGPVAHDAMPARYHAADLFMLTSWHESQGLVALEAAACGLPVLGTAVGVVPDLAPDAAVALDSRDPAAFARAALALLDDPARRATLARAGRAAVARDYAPAPAAARFVALYEELARGRR